MITPIFAVGLNKTLTESSQAPEYLVQKGLFSLTLSCDLFESILDELFELHALRWNV